MKRVKLWTPAQTKSSTIFFFGGGGHGPPGPLYSYTFAHNHTHTTIHTSFSPTSNSSLAQLILDSYVGRLGAVGNTDSTYSNS